MTSPVKYWFWKLLRIVTAGLLVATLLGALDRPVGQAVSGLTASIDISSVWQRLKGFARIEQRDDSAIAEQRPNLQEIPTSPALRKTVTIDAGRESVSVRVELFINKHEPLYDFLQKTVARPRDEWIAGNSDESIWRVATETFGLVSVDDRPLTVARSSLAVDETSSLARVQLDSEPLRYDDILREKQKSHLAVEVYLGSRTLQLDVSEIVINTDGVG